MSAERFSLSNAAEFIGREMGISDWITISQQRIEQFAACTGDRQWIHVDVERAQGETPLRSTIAHGFLILAMLARTIDDIVLTPAGIGHSLNYGLDRVRFLIPVKAGSDIRNRITLVAAQDKGGGRVLLTTENTVEIRGEAKPAMIARALVITIGS